MNERFKNAFQMYIFEIFEPKIFGLCEANIFRTFRVENFSEFLCRTFWKSENLLPEKTRESFRPKKSEEFSTLEVRENFEIKSRNFPVK